MSKRNRTEYNKKYYKDNKERHVAWREKNKDRIKESVDKYNKIYYEENKEYYQIHNKEYYENNKLILNKRNKKWLIDNKDRRKKYKQEYCEQNKDKIRESSKIYRNKRYNEDPKFRLRDIMSKSIRRGLKARNTSKNGYSCFDKLQYSIQELKKHLEDQFQGWMNWNNCGVYNPKTWDDHDSSTWTWQIDHIIPHSRFKYTSMDDEEFKKCWGLENLRPYSAKQNLLDSNRIR